MSDRISEVSKGDRFTWHGVQITVMRVSRDPYKRWADIVCVAENGNSWTKRQRLPLPEGTVRYA